MPIRTRVERVTVKETEISRAFKEGGDVRKNMRKTANYHVYVAQGESPKRTGAMALSIGYRILPAFNAYETMYSLTVGADYAKFTLAGTRAKITSNRGARAAGGPSDLTGSRSAAMLVRPAPFSHYPVPTLRTSVRGQVGRDWLGESTRIVFKALRLN
jgi:hypothetical protein